MQHKFRITNELYNSRNTNKSSIIEFEKKWFFLKKNKTCIT